MFVRLLVFSCHYVVLRSVRMGVRSPLLFSMSVILGSCEVNEVLWPFGCLPINVSSAVHVPEISVPSFRLRHVGWAVIVMAQRRSVSVGNPQWRTLVAFGYSKKDDCRIAFYFFLKPFGLLTYISLSFHALRFWFSTVCIFVQYIDTDTVAWRKHTFCHLASRICRTTYPDCSVSP